MKLLFSENEGKIGKTKRKLLKLLYGKSIISREEFEFSGFKHSQRLKIQNHSTDTEILMSKNEEMNEHRQFLENLVSIPEDLKQEMLRVRD